METIERGNVVEDIVTGFQGIAMARVVHLNGCVQFCVVPGVDRNGKMSEGEYIDRDRLKYVGKGVEAQSEQDAQGTMMRDCPSV